MSPSMQDLHAVMEAANAGTEHPADRLELIRRRVRRTRRVQLAAGAAATALTLGAAFALVPGLGGRETPVAAMTGTPAPGYYPQTREGLSLLKAVKFDLLGMKAQIKITPTGTTTMIAPICDRATRIFYDNGKVAGSAPCDRSGPGQGEELYIRTKVGVPLTLNILALPQTPDLQGDPRRIDKIALPSPPTSGIWSVGAYSGTCTKPECESALDDTPLDKITGSKIAEAQGTADSRQKTLHFTPSHGRVRLRLVCLDGASWAAAWKHGKMSAMIHCGAAKSTGAYWDETVEAGKAADFQIAVFPASTTPIGSVTGIAKLMKHPDPMGKWTLEVYDQDLFVTTSGRAGTSRSA